MNEMQVIQNVTCLLAVEINLLTPKSLLLEMHDFPQVLAISVYCLSLFLPKYLLIFDRFFFFKNNNNYLMPLNL
ncbi:hypothetical protein RIF29_35114 [Crotalaria pallida]|uniref:Uncharacterized protein n=1 Tax=Crotalaria pallida TaxID=3830 RepID=A0AAN9E9L1_CROPI